VIKRGDFRDDKWTELLDHALRVQARRSQVISVVVTYLFSALVGVSSLIAFAMCTSGMRPARVRSHPVAVILGIIPFAMVMFMITFRIKHGLRYVRCSSHR
jgi:hypothetical protein